MSKKRKISIRKVLQVLVTLIVTAGCVIAISSASNREIVKRISGLNVAIKNAQYHFIDKTEIKNMLFANRHIDIINTPVNKVDMRSMERIIAANPWVANAQVYLDNKRVLHVNVTQRVPVARIFEENGNSYYIDSTMNMMPISGRYVYYTTVVTGVPTLRNDSIGKLMMGQIAGLVKHIEHDTFWSAQVSQIVMMPDCSFELVPVLGNQRIILGDTSDIKEKLDNLFAFYKSIMNKIGWDKYDVLDLRYKDQVVASPAIPWKGPADKVMSDMSWVNSIMTMAAKDKPAVAFDTTAEVAANSMATSQVAVAAPPLSKVENAAAKTNLDAKRVIGPAEDKHMPAPTVQTVVKPASKPTVKHVIGPPVDKPAAKTSVTSKKKEHTSAKPELKAKSSSAKARLPTAKQPAKKTAADRNKKVEKKAETPKHKEEENKQQTPKYIYQNNNH